MASGGTDFNEDDFEEYNPHPYQGGYDIALTYGQPLPPSSATCYPISTRTTNSTASPSPPRPQPPPPSSSPPGPEPLPASYDYGLPENYQPEPFPSPDLFRNWPFLNSEDRDAYGGTRDYGFWNWRKALDYLFGHADGYGERRMGVDSYGIPVYANRKSGEESLVVQVEPALLRRLDYCDSHDERVHAAESSSYGGTIQGGHGYESHGERVYLANSDSWPSWYSETTKDESYDYENSIFAYNRHYSVEPLTIQMDPKEPVHYEKLSYHVVYPEQVHHNGWSSSYEDSSFMTSLFGNPDTAYNRHYQEEALHVHVEPVEPSWAHKLSYIDDYQESAFLKPHSVSSYDGKREDESNFFGGLDVVYESHSYVLHDNFQLEPFKSNWPQNVDYYEAYKEDVPPQSNWETSSTIFNWHYSLFADQNYKITNSGNPSHSYERHYHDQPLSVQLEPYKPTCSQYTSYHEVYNESSSPTSNTGDDSYFWPF